TYNEHVASHSQLSQAVPLLRQTIERLDGELAARQRELNEHTSQWKQYSIFQACADIEPAHKETWLSDRAQKLTAAQKKVDAESDRHQLPQDRREQRQQVLQQLQAEHAASADAAKDLAHHMQTLKERLTNAKKKHASGNTN